MDSTMARAPVTTTTRRWKLPSLENSSFALVFLVAFVLYYFINWKYLSTLWGLS